MVYKAHQQNITVTPLIGPSSLFLALMASGLNGQNFTFWGYLSRQAKQRNQQLKQLQNQSRKYQQTQMFMEAPHRNQKIIEAAIQHLAPSTLFCIAANLTLPNEYIKTAPIQEWKGKQPNLHKEPALFLLQTNN